MDANRDLSQYAEPTRNFRQLFVGVIPPSVLTSGGNSPAPLSSQSQPQSIIDSQSINSREISWWVEINTSVPLCLYYFGPFDSQREARDSRTGYVEDLYQEGARDIIALVKQCQPNFLTIERGYYRHST